MIKFASMAPEYDYYVEVDMDQAKGLDVSLNLTFNKHVKTVLATSFEQTGTNRRRILARVDLTSDAAAMELYCDIAEKVGLGDDSVVMEMQAVPELGSDIKPLWEPRPMRLRITRE
jgi:hypothetical protein